MIICGTLSLTSPLRPQFYVDVFCGRVILDGEVVTDLIKIAVIASTVCPGYKFTIDPSLVGDTPS